MLNRLSNKAMVKVVAIVGVMLAILLLSSTSLWAQDSEINYPENGTGPVATFDATDQDGDPIVWSLSGDDAKRFSINAGGELSFKSPPDYEKPNSASIGTVAEKNVYNVTIKATGGDHDVAVSVTNVDEAGSVSIDKPQPQVARGLEATLTDQDGGVSDEEWRWARSEDGETWTDIEGASSQSRNPAAADLGSFLRATVVYTDLFGSGKTVSAVTVNRVEARTVANAAPSFADQDDNTASPDTIEVSRSVGENAAAGAAVGKPVSATDADSDVLIYTLEDGNMVEDTSDGAPDGAMVHHDNDDPADPENDSKDGDSRQFTVDSATGQLKVKNDKLDFEVPVDVVDATELTGSADSRNTYIVAVIATDPSGARKAQRVTINVTNLKEAPTFTLGGNVPTVVRVKENDVVLFGAAGDVELPEASYVATDQDEADADALEIAGDDVTVIYGVEGADKKYFNISNDAGVLTINQKDPEGDGTTDYTPNYEAKSSYSITITATSGADDNRRTTKVNVTVNVLDGEDRGKVTLSQREPQVGQTVIATLTDPDGGITVTKWEWARVERTGTPLVCPTEFTPGVENANIIENASSAAYTPALADRDMCLQARVTYTDNIAGDGEGGDPVDNDGDGDESNTDGVYMHATTEAAVQISDPANAAPTFPDQDPTTSGDQSVEASRTIAENTKAGQSIGAPVTANDGDRELLLYALSGPDAASFRISTSNGQLTTKGDLDYETKATYQVVVNATDPSGASDSILVTINVTDEDDDAEIAGASSLDYAENGTGPVATFDATDQDGDPIEWSLSGDDVARFTIEGGVLAFKKSPDYEKPTSAVQGGTVAEKNVYNVTIKATGGDHDVAVSVTNVDEAGSVSIDKPQPQVARGLEATLTDQDGGVSDEEWRWARSEDGETWTDIEGASSQSRNPAAADLGSFLRATVVYTDLFGSGKTVSAVTVNRVEARTVANAAPSFADQDDNTASPDTIEVSRSVGENAAAGAAVGKPVSATDADSDVLIYTLEDGNMVEDTSDGAPDGAMVHHDNDDPADPENDSKDGDSRQFTVDSATGQLKVKNDKLDFEVPVDVVDATELTGSADSRNTYIVAVIATDPSGARKAQRVTINVTNLKEAPTFTLGGNVPTVVRVKENDVVLFGAAGDVELPEASYVATDQDEADADALEIAGDDVTVIYGVEGADKKYFNISNDAGVLTINQKDPEGDGTTDYTPNYEAKSSYSITITATSGADDNRRTTKVNVTVNVLDGEDRGKVTLSQREPQVGQTVIATLTDPDGGITVTKWEWARVERTGTPLVCPTEFTPGVENANIIENASSAAYTPALADRDMCLQARVTYTDNIAGDGEGGDPVDNDGDGDESNTDGVYMHATTEAAVQISDPANAAPTFPDQDPTTSGDQSVEASRTIAENTKAGQSIGAPVTANDGDRELLLYALSGPDAASFRISTSNGQLTTKGDLDYETKATYQVVVNATDPSGASDSILVTINVTDGPDKAAITIVDGGDPDPGNGGTTDPDPMMPDPEPEEYTADADGDGSISSEEILAAVGDYFDDEITAQQILDAIEQYFAD